MYIVSVIKPTLPQIRKNELSKLLGLHIQIDGKLYPHTEFHSKYPNSRVAPKSGTLGMLKNTTLYLISTKINEHKNPIMLLI